MSVVIALNREPVSHDLTGAFAGCSVTLRRLTSPEFVEARNAAIARLADRGALFILFEKWGLKPEGRKLADLTKDLDFMAGIGEWLAAVECGVRAISDWTGFLSAPKGPPLPVTREALEGAFLNDALMREVMGLIDRAAVLVSSEGKGSGVSPNGSPAHVRTASAPNTATAAAKAASPAPPASPEPAPASPAPKRSTRRRP